MRSSFVCLLCFAACTQFPQLDGTIAPEDVNAPYPGLVPLAPLIAAANRSETPAPMVTSTLDRAAALRARAARLRGPVLSAPDRRRMLQNFARTPQ